MVRWRRHWVRASCAPRRRRWWPLRWRWRPAASWGDGSSTARDRSAREHDMLRIPGCFPAWKRGGQMAQNTLAPWAELVPDQGPMTVDELLALPDDGWLYELVEGRLVRMAPPGGEHGEIALAL